MALAPSRGQQRFGCETGLRSRPSAELRDAVWKGTRDRASRHCETSSCALQGGSAAPSGDANFWRRRRIYLTSSKGLLDPPSIRSKERWFPNRRRKGRFGKRPSLICSHHKRLTMDSSISYDVLQNVASHLPGWTPAWGHRDTPRSVHRAASSDPGGPENHLPVDRSISRQDG